MTNCFEDLRDQAQRLAHDFFREQGAQLFQAQCAAWLANWTGVQLSPDAARQDYCEGYYFKAVVPAPLEGVTLELCVEMESCRPGLTVLSDGWQILGAEADDVYVDLPLEGATGQARPLAPDYIDHLREVIQDRHAAAHLTFERRPA